MMANRNQSFLVQTPRREWRLMMELGRKTTTRPDTLPSRRRRKVSARDARESPKCTRKVLTMQMHAGRLARAMATIASSRTRRRLARFRSRKTTMPEIGRSGSFAKYPAAEKCPIE
jgi:hypothetical protein